MNTTPNLGLRKPGQDDFYNVDDFNYNADILDAEATRIATASQDGRMSKEDKAKLDGIEAGAQVNTVISVAGKTGAVTLTKNDVGLGNVDNLSAASIRQDTTKALRTEVVSSFPSRTDGHIIYHSGDGKFYGRANGEWV